MVIEERHRILKCFHDLSDFSSRCFNVIVAQVVFILLSYTLRQWQLWKLQQEKLAGKTPGFLERELNGHAQFVVIYHEHAYAQLPVVSFTRELLELPPEAQAKALRQGSALGADSSEPAAALARSCSKRLIELRLRTPPPLRSAGRPNDFAATRPGCQGNPDSHAENGVSARHHHPGSLGL